MKYAALLLAVLLGALAVIFADPLSQWIGGTQEPDATVATVGEIRSVAGQVLSRPPRAVQLNPVLPGQIVRNQELLETQRNGDTVVQLHAGARLKVLPNSKVVFEADMQNPEAVNVTLLSGHVEILDPGTGDVLRVFRDGRRVLQSELATTEPMRIRPGSPAGPDSKAGEEPVLVATTRDEVPAASTPTPAGSPTAASRVLDRDTLSNDEIQSEIQKQTPFINRCFLTYISRTQDASAAGVALLAFTIEPTGRVSDARVLRSDLPDTTLQKCLVETIERTRFKNFNADPIRMEYPINLE